jgi:DNA-binding NarL/FixJ family response regulator
LLAGCDCPTEPRAYDRPVVRIASPTFVGRAAELAALDEALDSAAQGHTTTVLIGGDAGVGKSRLLETWNDRARKRGARVGSGACLDLGESGPAYVAIVQAFRELLGPMDEAAVDGLVGSDRSTLALIIPELSGTTGPGSDGQRSTPIAQTRLFDRSVRMLERASSDAPVVLELEDVHWADPSTRAFIIYLVANAPHAKLLIVATFRAEEAGREHPIASVLRELDRHGATRVDVLPFDADEVREQLHGILGEVPTGKLVAAIHRRSEGNALFAEELLASGDPSGELPTSIGAALLSRTAGLSSTARVALRVASVAGRTVAYDVLRSSTQLADDLLDAALREVVGVNILEPMHQGEHYRFRHALLQEAMYQDTLPGERRRLHAAVASALDSNTEEPADNPRLSSELAYHWFEAKDHDRAFLASLAAADAAMRQAAYAEALHHYEQALSLWNRATSGRVGLRQVDILERTTRSAFLAGEPQKALEFAQRGLAELDETTDPSLVVHALSDMARARHDVGYTDDGAEFELRLAAVDPAGLSIMDQITVLDARIWSLRRKGQMTAARDVTMEAIQLTEAIEDAEVNGIVHVKLAEVLWGDRDTPGAIGEAHRANEFAKLAGDVETQVHALRVIFMAYAGTGEHEMAIAAAQEARAFAEEVGLSRTEAPWASLVEARALFELGRITESAEVIRAALTDPPSDRATLVLNTLAGHVAIAIGSTEEAAQYLKAARIPEASIDDENGRGYLATVRAELAMAEGRLELVIAIVDATAPRVAMVPFSDMSETTWPLVEIGLDAVAAKAEAARSGADEAAVASAQSAKRVLIGYLEEVRRRRAAGQSPDTGKDRGDEALIEGHVARIEGRDDPSLWKTAAESFPPRSPRALAARYRQAEAMLATGARREEIRAVMADANAIAVEIGARPLANRFESLARRARIDLRPATAPHRPADAVVEAEEPSEPGTVALRGRGLSDREIEVLTLVSAGFSNHDIGMRLFISDKTASVHVSHILRKLDAATRTEAATIGVRLGLPDIGRDNGAR